MAATRLDAVVSLAKRRGFVYPCGEIYGGTKSAWDYGPLGVELKDNIKRQWWNAMVRSRDDIVGLDSSVILPRQVWVASGHVAAFVDPLVECLSCHKRYRADHLQEEFEEKKGRAPENGMADIACPNCGTRGQWTEPKEFNGLLKTYLGPVEDESGLHYLRPETAQGIFVNYNNVASSSRKKPPFGIGQIGKSFRNEITPGNFIFRTREFEQMEMEFFVKPGTDEEWHQYWIDTRTEWYVDLGLSRDNLRQFEHPKEKLSHYSKRTVDIEYRFHFGNEWGELEGIANRTDFDLKTHSEHSGVDLSYFDQETGERWTPYVVEPAAGVEPGDDRLPAGGLRRGRGAEHQGRRRQADRCCGWIRGWRRSRPRCCRCPGMPTCRRSPATWPRRCASPGTSSSTTPARSAAATGGRTRSAPRSASPSTSTPPTDQAVTIRDRDSMTQERVALDQVQAYLAARLIGC